MDSAHDLGDIAISSRILELMIRLKVRNDIRDLLNNYLTNYDICRQNSNVLTHFTAHIPEEADSESFDLKAVSFVRVKGISANKQLFPSSLTDIRRAAVDIRGLALHSWRIYEVLELLAPGKPSELPPLIVAPELLVKPPQNNSPILKRQPKLSRAERRKRARHGFG
jgi:hypothetical protein